MQAPNHHPLLVQVVYFLDLHHEDLEQVVEDQAPDSSLKPILFDHPWNQEEVHLVEKDPINPYVEPDDPFQDLDLEFYKDLELDLQDHQKTMS